eukprot:4064159-Pleurochrysis_carterae.AAC.1
MSKQLVSKLLRRQEYGEARLVQHRWLVSLIREQRVMVAGSNEGERAGKPVGRSGQSPGAGALGSRGTAWPLRARVPRHPHSSG